MEWKRVSEGKGLSHYVIELGRRAGYAEVKFWANLSKTSYKIDLFVGTNEDDIETALNSVKIYAKTVKEAKDKVEACICKVLSGYLKKETVRIKELKKFVQQLNKGE